MPARENSRGRRLLGRALGGLAVVSGERRLTLLQDAAELLRRHGNYREIAKASSAAAYVALTEDRLDQASTLVDTAREAGGKVDDAYLNMNILGNVGLVMLFLARSAQLESRFRGRSSYAASTRREVGECLALLAAVTAAEQRDELARRLLGAARTWNYPPNEFDRRMEDRLERDYFAPARMRVGTGACCRSEGAGATLSYEQAINEALTARDEYPR